MSEFMGVALEVCGDGAGATAGDDRNACNTTVALDGTDRRYRRERVGVTHRQGH